MRGEGGPGDREGDDASPRVTLSMSRQSSAPPARGGQSPCEHSHSTQEAATHQPARCLPPWSSTARRLPSRPGTAGAVGGETISVPGCRSEHQGPRLRAPAPVPAAGPPPSPGAAWREHLQGSEGTRKPALLGWELSPWRTAVDTAWAPRPGQRPWQSKVQVGLKRQQGCGITGGYNWPAKILREISLKTS